jgi:hypothetical protein
MESDMSSSAAIRLGRLDRVPDRLFTQPEHSLTDRALLERMRARLQHTLTHAGSGAGDPLHREQSIQHVQEDDGRLQRMVILAREQLLAPRELTIVGFFGEKRGEANHALLQDVDAELLQEFLHHTYVLSYSSLETDDGNWANMVIMLGVEGIEHWRSSQKHAYAARELAPHFYRNIRLRNGVLPNGLASPHMLFTSTKYYDFHSDGMWYAVREETSEHEQCV